MEMQVNMNAASAPKVKDAGKAKKRRKLLRRIIMLMLVLVVTAFAGYFAYTKLKQEYTVTYQSYSATTGSISNSLSFSGTLQAVNSQIYTADSATKVRSVYVVKGADVQEGDKLVRLANGTTVEADFAGTVNQLYIAEGDEVTAGTSLIQVVDFAHQKVSIRVDEYDISDVHEGDAIVITTTATEKAFESVIDDINYVSSSSGSVAYYTATAYVETDGSVYPGMQVTVSIPQEEASNVVILKEDAISFDATNQAFVYTQNADGTLEQTYITTGVSNGNYVEITSGLRAGDTVYVEVEETESSSGGLFASLFGGQQMMGGGQMPSGQSGERGGPGSNFGGERPSAPGGNNGSGGNSGNGGGRQ